MRRCLSAWLPALALLALSAGCRSPQPAAPGATTDAPAAAAQPVRIGAVFPLSAGAGRIGEMKRQGADLAVEHLNAGGGVGGRPLEIVYVDSKNSVTEATTGFNKLLDVDQVPVVMSAMSQVSLALVGPADRRQVVLFANASHPKLTERSPFVFRNLPSTAQTSKAMAEAAYRELGLRRVAVLSINDEYGADAATQFQEWFTSLGGAVTGTDTFDLAATDFRTQLTRLAATRPEGWWIPGYGAALGLVLKQKEALQIGGLTLCDLGLADANVLRTAAGAADGAAVVVPAFDPADPREAVQRFVKDFEAKYQEAPSFDAAFQYDAVFLIADALERAAASGGMTGPAVRDALATTQGFVGVCGPTTFDEQGDAQMQVRVRLMVDGRLQPLERLDQAPPAKATTDTTPTDEAGAE